MSSELIVRFNPQQEWRIDLSRLEPMGMEEARRWLDDQFTAMECEPLRASGKVLLADKVLLVAQAAGPAAWTMLTGAPPTPAQPTPFWSNP